MTGVNDSTGVVCQVYLCALFFCNFFYLGGSSSGLCAEPLAAKLFHQDDLARAPSCDDAQGEPEAESASRRFTILRSGCGSRSADQN